jgi:hypothetical protein
MDVLSIAGCAGFDTGFSLVSNIFHALSIAEGVGQIRSEATPREDYLDLLPFSAPIFFHVRLVKDSAGWHDCLVRNRAIYENTVPGTLVGFGGGEH